ncbi:unnamed protein product [Brachionus calyciflorus]|uniref:PiggyBac transposable element-derived protein domain-containing protein n=1 Tax=Brachionus calyciflorus TaxID=104777 RepID=A0A813ME56_9BILA|nr:unnamed protein product [Brachionus calyciflorus]
MTRRVSAQKALEIMRNADKTQSVYSDEEDRDFEDREYNEEDSEPEILIDCEEFDGHFVSDDENDDDVRVTFKRLLKTQFNVSLKNNEETTIRKKIDFNEKVGPTSYAARQIESTKLSSFLLVFDVTMVKMVLNYTNMFAITKDPNLKFTKDDVFLFIGVLFYRGVTCQNVPVVSMWSKEDVIINVGPETDNYMSIESAQDLYDFSNIKYGSNKSYHGSQHEMNQNGCLNSNFAYYRDFKSAL